METEEKIGGFGILHYDIAKDEFMFSCGNGINYDGLDTCQRLNLIKEGVIVQYHGVSLIRMSWLVKYGKLKEK